VRAVPAGRDEVGGDWYDAFERAPGQLALVIGDVLGHDITAAAAMAQLRATLRSVALDRPEGPADVLGRGSRSAPGWGSRRWRPWCTRT
jgi:serine phosphatase RsbU (regulator of sigma subunit)